LDKRYEPIPENVVIYKELAEIYEKMYESTANVFPLLNTFNKKHY